MIRGQLKEIERDIQQDNFSMIRRGLMDLFGHGGGTFWNLPDSETQVKLNHDLNPNNTTSELFGFGNQRERSGLF